MMAGRFVAASVLVVVLGVGSSEAKMAAVLGVPPERLILYDSSRDFKCLNGAQSLSFDQVNDDYCDCADGSDEPGTSACSNSIFYCENPGHRRMEIPSYRVNDGVCDCCDGTDEHGTGKCGNTCEEAGREMRERAAAEKLMREEGIVVRKELAGKAAALRQARDARLAELEPQIVALEAKKAAQEEVKAAAEAPEKEAKSNHDTWWDNELTTRKDRHRKDIFAFIDADADGNIALAEVQSRVAFDDDGNGEVSLEEATKFFDQDADGALNETEAVMGYERFEADEYDGAKDKFKDDVPPLDDVKPDYDEPCKAKMATADEARKAFNEARDAAQTLVTEKDGLVKKNGNDYGTDGAWAAADGECFDAEISEYKYTICPFGKASQAQKTGGGNTNLGNFKGFTGPDGNKYSKMSFEGGQKCWNGPSRSLTVEVLCGAKGELSNIQEPSKCEYTGTFRHPAICEEVTGAHDEL